MNLDQVTDSISCMISDNKRLYQTLIASGKWTARDEAETIYHADEHDFTIEQLEESIQRMFNEFEPQKPTLTIRQYIDYTAPYVVTDADNASDYANAFWQHLHDDNDSLPEENATIFDEQEFKAIAIEYYNDIYSLDCFYLTYPKFGTGGNLTAKKVPFVAGTEMQFAVTSEELMIARIEFDPEVAKRLTKHEAERLKSVSSYRANYLM